MERGRSRSFGACGCRPGVGSRDQGLVVGLLFHGLGLGREGFVPLYLPKQLLLALELRLDLGLEGVLTCDLGFDLFFELLFPLRFGSGRGGKSPIAAGGRRR